MSIDEAKDVMDRWFGFYTNVKPWMEARGMDVETQGFVTGLWGLKRRLPAIMSKEADLADLKRQAGNGPIQGFASDFNCFLILLVMDQVKSNGLRDKIKMVNTVHDSIVFEVCKGYEGHLIRYYYEAMASMNEWCAELFGGKEYYIDMCGDLEVGPTYGNLKGARIETTSHGDLVSYTYSLGDD